MNMKKILIISATVALLTGCVGANATKGLASLSSNLSKDHALFIVNTDLITPWGQQKGKLVRVGDLTNTVTVSPEGTVTVNPGK